MRYLFIKSTLASTLLALSGLCYADEPMAMEDGFWDSVQVHGFLTQGFIQTSDNQVRGDSTRGSFEFTELGVNFSVAPSPDLLLSAQLLARNAGISYDADEPVLDYALVDYQFSESEQHRSGIRLGRIKNPLGLYNEVRDVAFTRPGVFSPQVVYFDKIRSFLLSSDGVQGYSDLYGDFGDVSFVLGAGVTQVDDKVESAYLLRDFAGFMKSSGTTWVGQVMYTTPDTDLKLGASVASTRMKFTPGQGDPLLPGYTNVRSLTLSVQYDVEDWRISAEYLNSPLEWHNYGPLVARESATVEGYYLQGAYRARSDIELMLRYEEGYGDRTDKDGTKFEATTGGLIPARNQFSKIWTIGVRWDPTDQTMLRAEYQLHDGDFVLSNQENPVSNNMVGNWDLFTIQASYRF